MQLVVKLAFKMFYESKLTRNSFRGKLSSTRALRMILCSRYTSPHFSANQRGSFSQSIHLEQTKTIQPRHAQSSYGLVVEVS